jgi:hypothetical protein
MLINFILSYSWTLTSFWMLLSFSLWKEHWGRSFDIICIVLVFTFTIHIRIILPRTRIDHFIMFTLHKSLLSSSKHPNFTMHFRRHLFRHCTVLISSWSRYSFLKFLRINKSMFRRLKGNISLILQFILCLNRIISTRVKWVVPRSYIILTFWFTCILIKPFHSWSKELHLLWHLRLFKCWLIIDISILTWSWSYLPSTIYILFIWIVTEYILIHHFTCWRLVVLLFS